MRHTVLRTVAAGWLVTCAIASTSRAGDPGSAGATFLKVPVDARPAAMGEAYTAAGFGVAALSYNPAGIAWGPWSEISFMHDLQSVGSGAPNTNLEYLGAAIPIPGIGTAAVQFRLQSYGSNPGYDPYGQALPNWDASDSAIGLAYARAIELGGGQMALGGGIQVVRVGVADVSSSFAPSLDLGGRYRTKVPGLELGASLLHLGPGVTLGAKSSPQPITARLGGSFGLGFGAPQDGSAPGFETLLAMDVGIPSDHGAWVGLGLEAAYREMGFFRIGYRSGVDQGGAAGFGLGGGFRYDSATAGGSLDLSYHPAGVVGSQLRLSISLRYLLFAPAPAHAAPPATPAKGTPLPAKR